MVIAFLKGVCNSSLVLYLYVQLACSRQRSNDVLIVYLQYVLIRNSCICLVIVYIFALCIWPFKVYADHVGGFCIVFSNYIA